MTTLSQKNIIAVAVSIWDEEWKKQGSKDEGTCCGGKGIKLDGNIYANFVNCEIDGPPRQGNVSAYQSVGPALKFIKENGYPKAEYYDGWMD